MPPLEGRWAAVRRFGGVISGMAPLKGSHWLVLLIKLCDKHQFPTYFTTFLKGGHFL